MSDVERALEEGVGCHFKITLYDDQTALFVKIQVSFD